MADEEPATPSENASEEPVPIALPPRESLPPPPDVTYTRPFIAPGMSAPRSSASGKPFPGIRPEPEELGQDRGVSGHGAGLAAGTTFVVSIIAGAVAGNFMDQRWNHTGMPWATLIMTLLGATTGFINMQRILNRSSRNQKKP